MRGTSHDLPLFLVRYIPWMLLIVVWLWIQSDAWAAEPQAEKFSAGDQPCNQVKDAEHARIAQYQSDRHQIWCQQMTPDQILSLRQIRQKIQEILILPVGRVKPDMMQTAFADWATLVSKKTDQNKQTQLELWPLQISYPTNIRSGWGTTYLIMRWGNQQQLFPAAGSCIKAEDLYPDIRLLGWQPYPWSKGWTNPLDPQALLNFRLKTISAQYRQNPDAQFATDEASILDNYKQTAKAVFYKGRFVEDQPTEDWSELILHSDIGSNCVLRLELRFLKNKRLSGKMLHEIDAPTSPANEQLTAEQRACRQVSTIDHPVIAQYQADRHSMWCDKKMQLKIDTTADEVWQKLLATIERLPEEIPAEVIEEQWGDWMALGQPSEDSIEEERYISSYIYFAPILLSFNINRKYFLFEWGGGWYPFPPSDNCIKTENIIDDLRQRGWQPYDGQGGLTYTDAFKKAQADESFKDRLTMAERMYRSFDRAIPDNDYREPHYHAIAGDDTPMPPPYLRMKYISTFYKDDSSDLRIQTDLVSGCLLRFWASKN